MRHENCIFADEDDCPKEAIHLTCEECKQHKLYETIERAVRDFTGLGEAFTEVFELHKTLIDNNGKSVEIKIPDKSIFLINHVMATFLSRDPETTEEGKIYRRLIFYFFSILIDDFESDEYKVKSLLN